MNKRAVTNHFVALIPFIAALSMIIPAHAKAKISASQPLMAVAPSGGTVNVSSIPGWRVIYFWSASCPCVKACERYSFIPMAEKYKGKVSFFAMASDGWDLSMPRQQLDYQIASHHLPYPVLLDTQHVIAKALKAQVTPQTFILNPAGKVVFTGMPDDSRRFLFDPSAAGKHVAHTYLSTALSEALAGKPVTNSPLREAGCIVAW